MRNDIFKLIFNHENGGVSSLSLVGDPFEMNFCRGGKTLFTLRNFELEAFEENEDRATAVSSYQGVRATTKYAFKKDVLTVSTVLRNENSYPVYYKNGDVLLEIPFNDAYESSDVCMRERCHAHIWAGLENSYVRLERMGESEYNLGVLFRKGSFSSYRQEECAKPARGHFSLNVSPFVILGGETYEISYTVFRHRGGDDFYDQAKALDGYMRVISNRGYTFRLGEKIEFCVEVNEEINTATCSVKDLDVSCKAENGKAVISFVPPTVDEYEVVFKINEKTGKAVFNVVPDIDKLIETRLRFIVEKQQCTDKRSPLYGAYLIYDNEERCQYFDYTWTDHNANRERMGMSLAIAKWLQNHNDETLRSSLDMFTEFLLRECVNEENGTCYGNIGKDESYLRLYNAPWVMLYFTELYKLTDDKRWIELVIRIIRYYYRVGGAKFYPNGVRFYTMYREIQRAGLEAEAKEVYALFDKHVQTILKNDVIYPPHEVNFEQTIVTPAVTVLIDKYLISGEEFYLHEAKKHLRILRKFDGSQPHYRLNTIPIRYWDDFWFGKNGAYGDVFPHYWSVLSGYGYYLYYKATKDKTFMEYARRCMENCLCNIHEDGSATCSYLFPQWVSGRAQTPGKPERKSSGERKGGFANAFANDQDFLLYFLMKMKYDQQEK